MLRVTFLGTGGSIPTTERNPSGVMVEMEGDLLLFDCGEGIQRQMMKHGTGFGVDAVFLSHIHGDHILGLPGLFQTWTFQGREKPVDIYCPNGMKNVVEDCARLGGHSPAYDIRIHEVGNGYSIEMGGYSVEVFRTKHWNVNSVGYSIEEDDRKGRFDRQKAEELGVPPGPLFSKLHEGERVELEDGTTVSPDQVVGEPRPGRKVVYTGDTRTTDEILEASRDASLLIHDGMFGDEMSDRAYETGHSTVREAAKTARDADVEMLALTHVSSRYSDGVEPLVRQAREIFSHTEIAYDGMQMVVEYPEKDRETRVV
ncbi:MAG: ribonuclease Z [Halobacteria archaeon]|nr:ribonuclease Z [Halobacteria archaeon]